MLTRSRRSSGRLGEAVPVREVTGDILEADTEALVNPVNCVGVMGKGLALRFKQRFPQNFRLYEAACRAGEVKPGEVFVVPMYGGFFIVNFPTKRHWKQPSRLEDIDAGLVDLVRAVNGRGIRSIAIPALGCGLGGLAWSDVRPRIVDAFASFPEVEIVLYAPQE